MRRFVYISADRGIPVPGHKGSSHHVTHVCRAMRRAGLTGALFTARPRAAEIDGVPVRSLDELADERLQPDFVYERYSLWHLDGLDWARRAGVPFFLEVNSPLPREAKRFRGLADEREADRVASRLMREADGVVCVSRAVADWVATLRRSPDGIWVVPNGVDETLFSPDVAAATVPFGKAEGPVVGFCGSFRPWHGVSGLLAAASISRVRPRVLCIGDGPGRESFERRAEELGLSSRVHVTGFVPHEQVARWLAACDLAVAPYERCDDFYFSPLKMFEPMALGIPVVAADLGQLREVLDGGERGTLYAAGDVQGLARAIDTVASDRQAALRGAALAQYWVLRHATWTKRVQTILERVGGVRVAHG